MVQQTTNSTNPLAGTEPAYTDLYDDEPKVRERYQDSGKYGVMFTGDYKWDNVRCTREAYGDSDVNYGTFRRRSLQFHTTWMDVEQAVECVREIPTYNGFRPDHVVAVLESLPETVRVVVAREGSPALYLWTQDPKTVFSAFASMTAAESLIDEEERKAAENLPLRSHSERAASPFVYPPDELGGVPESECDHYPVRVVGADIGGLESGERTLIRAWWD